ncbi:hypothetical protein HK096_011107 [Nowakowskiella sp. JEL0078]|nr:hypothetical protein HK096_011107 [Nowakowskiella sp. JEL0078]
MEQNSTDLAIYEQFEKQQNEKFESLQSQIKSQQSQHSKLKFQLDRNSAKQVSQSRALRGIKEKLREEQSYFSKLLHFIQVDLMRVLWDRERARSQQLQQRALALNTLLLVKFEQVLKGQSITNEKFEQQKRVLTEFESLKGMLDIEESKLQVEYLEQQTELARQTKYQNELKTWLETAKAQKLAEEDRKKKIDLLMLMEALEKQGLVTGKVISELSELMVLELKSKELNYIPNLELVPNIKLLNLDYNMLTTLNGSELPKLNYLSVEAF